MKVALQLSAFAHADLILNCYFKIKLWQKVFSSFVIELVKTLPDYTGTETWHFVMKGEDVLSMNSIY